MNKIPTIFERDWDGGRSRVLDIPAAGCEWVFAGEGVATRKYDGTCCLVRDGALYKRHEVRAGKTTPEGFGHQHRALLMRVNRSFEKDRERALYGQTQNTSEALRKRVTAAPNGHA